MQKNCELTAGRASNVLRPSARILGRTILLAGLGLLAWLHQPDQGFGAIPVEPYGMVLTWEPSASTTATGYRVYSSTASGHYTNSLAVGNVTAATFSGLMAGVTYFFTITAYTTNGQESAFSNEISFVPGTPQVQIRAASSQQLVLNVSGLIGHLYDIEATQDFKTWQVIGRVTLGSTGLINFTDQNATLFSRRFYRTLQKN